MPVVVAVVLGSLETVGEKKNKNGVFGIDTYWTLCSQRRNLGFSKHRES